MYIFCSWVPFKACLQWLQLVTRVRGIFSVLGYILKFSYSGYKGLKVYFLFLDTS